MGYFQKEFKYSETSYYENDGPSELQSSIGSLAMNFSMLEDELSFAVICVLGITVEKGLSLTSEMSFKAKLNIFSTVMKTEIQTLKTPFSLDDLNDLIAMCTKSEEFRNRILHSSWVFDFAKNEIRRRKLASKISYGFRHVEEPLNAGQVQDIADYIVHTAVMIDEFIINCFPEFKKPLKQHVYE